MDELAITKPAQCWFSAFPLRSAAWRAQRGRPDTRRTQRVGAVDLAADRRVNAQADAEPASSAELGPHQAMFVYQCARVRCARSLVRRRSTPATLNLHAGMAERLCIGLPSRQPRFDPGRPLQNARATRTQTPPRSDQVRQSRRAPTQRLVHPFSRRRPARAQIRAG